MTKLNHINLAVSNVPELTRFFQSAFGFHLTDQRGTGKFAVLVGDDGFALVLSYDKNASAKPYPGLFHVGFLFATEDEVNRYHQRIVEAGFDAPIPAILQRGGPKTFGFYCNAPGGVTVEVSANAA
jgi:catechol 2,3-dioxygenase-like lactoylglutathione lyase family enzyme